MSKYIVGISAYYHDSSIALVSQTQVVDFIKEEWLTRNKGDSCFPHHSLRNLTEKYSLDENNISAIVFYERPLLSWLELLRNAAKKKWPAYKMISHLFTSFWNGPIFFHSEIKVYFPKISKKQIFYSHHHLSHIGSVLPFLPNECGNTHNVLHLVLDGYGEGISGGIWDKDFNNIHAITYPHSLGIFYSAITEFLGYKINEDEYKVMALAAFGQTNKNIDFSNILFVENGEIFLNEKFFAFMTDPETSLSKLFYQRFKQPSSSLDQFAKDFAHTAQVLLEKCVIEYLDHYLKKYNNKIKYLSFSGGVAHNSKLILEISRAFPDVNIITSPTPGDSGAAFGSAVILNKKIFNSETESSLFPCKRSFSTKSKVENKLFKLSSFVFTETADIVSSLLKDGETIAFFNNFGEFGPRALGSTSLFCDGKNEWAVQYLNTKLKKRENFRPLAPVCLEEVADEYFVITPNLRRNLHWMGALVPARDITLRDYPGICHVDGTCRLQLIDEHQHPYIGKFMKTFYKNDLKILVNTSFNVAGDPMVYDVIDAYSNLKRLDIHKIVIGTKLYEIV